MENINNLNNSQAALAQNSGDNLHAIAGFVIIIIILLVWSMVWKGFALWKAARNSSKPWFIILLVLSTLGILEILYIFVFSKMGESKKCACGKNSTCKCKEIK
ncbi:MAG: DUF5652 family protein [Candidatus Nomurabacteria bacterium]